MGLLYPFPVSHEETDFVENKNGQLILKTYGLPYIFWFYAFCIIAVIFFMFLAIKAPILKLVALGDETDSLLGNSLLTFIGVLPIGILAFFFYEKRIIASQDKLTLQHRVFGLPLFTENFPLNQESHLTVKPFLSSPNMARMKALENEIGFQNKGYFVLWLERNEGKKIQLDRHSRKQDLEKLKLLLESVMNPKT
jgi:hypothetical protein